MFSQCFGPPNLPSRPDGADELIRQVTIDMPERGLLVLRIRDEMRLLVAAYQTLYESSLAFSIRKALHEEATRGEREVYVRKGRGLRVILYQMKMLETEKKELERQVGELATRVDATEKREQARWEEGGG
jgi:dynein light intermediate chain, axonemal